MLIPWLLLNEENVKLIQSPQEVQDYVLRTWRRIERFYYVRCWVSGQGPWLR